jgi:hypothetical protein
MLQYTKTLASVLGLLTGISLYAMEDLDPATTTSRTVDAGNYLYVTQNPKEKHKAEVMASYWRCLGAYDRTDRPENVPAEAIYLTHGWNAWVLPEGTNIFRDAWNEDGTLYQPLYAWKVYCIIKPSVIAQTEYNQFIEAYKAKFAGFSFNPSAFESVVAPYNFGSVITLTGDGSKPAFNNYCISAASAAHTIKHFLTMFEEKVTAVTTSGASSAAASAASSDA